VLRFLFIPDREELLMFRPALAATAALLLAAPLLAQGPVYKSSLHDYRVVPVADGFVNPWGMAFLPGGDILVTERPGRLRIVRGGKLLEKPVAGVPAVVARGQGGLLDIVLHPQFATNRFVYLSFSKPTGEPNAATTAVIRAKFENDALTDVREVFLADTKGAPGHFGSRLAFGPDGMLYITVGDRQVPPTGNLEAHPAQDPSNHHGTINRIHDDGRAPADNPFAGQAGRKPEIFSYGHRNPQGLAFDTDGNLWATEHGPQGGDELNLITAGKNYGWPVIGFGVNYRSGAIIHSGTVRDGMEQPKHVWVPSIAVSGLMVYTGDKFPEWKGSIFAGGLAGEQIARLARTGTGVELGDVIVRGKGRVRDVRQGLDGFIYVALESRDGAPTSIVRLEPVARR
jgi:aldose sugar dehydrogenase